MWYLLMLVYSTTADTDLTCDLSKDSRNLANPSLETRENTGLPFDGFVIISSGLPCSQEIKVLQKGNK